MEAWKAGFPTDEYLPLPNLACVGLPIRAEKEEWLKLAGGDGLLEGELEKYYDLFKNADSLGSLIQIEEGGTLVPGDVRCGSWRRRSRRRRRPATRWRRRSGRRRAGC
jgi:hypothetical protein